MTTTFTIAKREFRAYFNSPIAYVVICLTLFILGLVFFGIIGSGFFHSSFWLANRASVEQMFILLPRALSLLVVPAVTMRLLAEEKRAGTLELLITLPVKDSEVIVGKFLGAWGLVLVLIAATSLYPLMMFGWPWHLGSLDSGPVWSAYVGLALYSAAAVSIGLLVSALTDNQFVSLIVTFVILVLLHFIGAGGTAFPKFEWVTQAISFDMRIGSFLRGMINTRDVIYFATITAGCLMGSFWALERRKWS